MAQDGVRPGCLRCLLLVMCMHPFVKEALTLHLARSEGHERYFSCNLMHRKVLASSYQHLMAEAPHRTGKVESGLFHEFYESVQEALAHFEWVHLENIERSALEESKITRQTVRYEVGEILNGQLKDGKVKYATIGSKFRPPKAEASMWLLERSFPDSWGPQAKEAAHEGKARDRQATVIFYKRDKNGRICDLVLPLQSSL